MSATGLEVFDKTIQTTNIWLGESVHEIGPDRHVAKIQHVLPESLRSFWQDTETRMLAKAK